MTTAAGYLVRTLHEAGVTRIYGVVGDSLNPIVDAIRRTDGIANALSIPPKVTATQMRGFALGVDRTVLDGGVGKMAGLARSNLRNLPRP